MGRVIAFNHFSATVSDMEVALSFWQDGLELELLGRGIVEYEHLDHIVGLAGTRIEWAELKIDGGGIVELFRYHAPQGAPLGGWVNDPGKTHLCLEVEDVDYLIKRLRGRGFPPVHGAGAVEIPVGDWKGFRSVYVRAPDDVVVELVETHG
jgi:catechol 2,3-dioxygenase-like lactoylglutathione lyase family enzyme